MKVCIAVFEFKEAIQHQGLASVHAVQYGQGFSRRYRWSVVFNLGGFPKLDDRFFPGICPTPAVRGIDMDVFDLGNVVIRPEPRAVLVFKIQLVLRVLL